jgi:uncharacterized protein (TIGR03435 family)
MFRATACAVLMALASGGAFAQSPDPQLTFEVASVKPAAPQPPNVMRVMMSGGPGTPDPGQLRYVNVALKNVIMTAYGLKRYQVQTPAWMDTERYDITAKIPKGTTKEEFQAMLQNLLAERFKLVAHREKKDLPMYALLVAKGGPKMKESAEDPPAKETDAPGGPSAGGFSAGAGGGHMDGGRVTVGKDGFPQMPPEVAKRGGAMMMRVSDGRFHMQMGKQTMAGFADMLGNSLDRPVVDMTELKGKYDFTLDYTPEEGQGMMGPMGKMPPMTPPVGHEGGPGAAAPDPQSGPSLFTALQEQLGLKLEPRKGPVDLLVVDRAEKVPTEN